MKNFSLNTRLIINFITIAAIGMFIAGVLSYRYSYNKVYDLTVSNLVGRLKAIEASIQISYHDNIERQKNLSQILKAKISSRISIDENNMQTAIIENQISHAEFFWIVDQWSDLLRC